MSSWLSDATANRYRKTYFNGFVDVSGGDIILRTGNIKLLSGAYPTISSNNNTITFDDIYQFTNFNNNVHILGIQQLDYGGSVYDVGSLISQIGTMTYYQPSDFNIFNNIYCAGQIQYLEAGTGAHVDLVGKVLTNINDIATNTTNIATNKTSISTLNTRTTDISYLAGTPNTTTIANKLQTSVLSFGTTLNGVSPTTFGYISTLSANAQTALDSKCSLSGNQTIAGIKTFSSPPVMSGASITTGTIPIASVVGTAMDLTTSQTVAGVKTFSSAPVMSGASITTGTIPITSVVGTAVALSGTQVITGQKQFTSTPIIANIGISGSMTLSSDVQTQLNNSIIK